MKMTILWTALAGLCFGQVKFMQCTQNIPAFGQHVRFTTEEHLQILLNERAAREAQEFPYISWEYASDGIDWFGGTKPISLSEIKSHMPRAMLLKLRFPVDQHPRAVQADVDRLIAAEKKYYEAQKMAETGHAYLTSLMKKYGMGQNAAFDQDMGGATPMADCGKYEEVQETKPDARKK